jgi:predicted lipoprotein with Yx(FWY)xxD motif
MRSVLRDRPSRRYPRARSITATLAAVFLVMLVGGGLQSASSGAVGPAIDPAASGPPTIEVVHTNLGQILADAKGMVLYRYTADRKNVSNCYSAYGCEALWPILSLGPGRRVAAGASVVQSALGVITRKDGKKQVTYDGWPLYTYVVDRKPGQTAGEGFKDARGIWLVVYATPSKNPSPTP